MLLQIIMSNGVSPRQGTVKSVVGNTQSQYVKSTPLFSAISGISLASSNSWVETLGQSAVDRSAHSMLLMSQSCDNASAYSVSA